MKNRIISGTVITILGLLLAIGPWYIFKVCGSTMKCYWAGRAELGIGILLIVLGILNVAVASVQVRLGLNLTLIFVGIEAALIPTWLIGVCGMPKMSCHAVAAPSILLISILVSLLAIGMCFTSQVWEGKGGTIMKPRKLGITAISIQNLISRRFRTICLCCLVAVLSFTVFSGFTLTYSLKNGLKSVEHRLGADLMIVPEGNKTNTKVALLRGEPGAFYFEKNTESIISGIEGVSKISSQFFLSSLSTGCCSFPIQLIGYDPKTDFVIAHGSRTTKG